MSGNRANRRAAEADPIRAQEGTPSITDTTERITPVRAQEMLRKNKNNRPMNWKKVEHYSKIMARGEWKLHAQGIILDVDENILTGQKRLWAIIYSDTPALMRVSRGNQKDIAKLLDRGDPQSARDLAARGTGRRLSPSESSIARAMCAHEGNVRPSKEELAEAMESNADYAEAVLESTKGTKKTRAVLMVLAAMCALSDSCAQVRSRSKDVTEMVETFEGNLSPHTAKEFWNKGAAFALAMREAVAVVRGGAR